MTSITKALDAYYRDLHQLRGRRTILPHAEARGQSHTKDLLSLKEHFTPCLEHATAVEEWRNTPAERYSRKPNMPYMLIQECRSCYKGSVDTWLAHGYRYAKAMERPRLQPYIPWYRQSRSIVLVLFPHVHTGPDYDKWKVGECCWQAALESWQATWGGKDGSQ